MTSLVHWFNAFNVTFNRSILYDYKYSDTSREDMHTQCLPAR